MECLHPQRQLLTTQGLAGDNLLNIPSAQGEEEELLLKDGDEAGQRTDQGKDQLEGFGHLDLPMLLLDNQVKN